MFETKCWVFPLGVIVPYSFHFHATLPSTSLESNCKPQVAHQFIIRTATQKGTTQPDKVVCILLYTKGDRYA